MKIETTKYLFAHGKAPKGFGMWVFEFTGITKGSGLEFKTQKSFTANFGMASVEAIRAGKEMGAFKVRVLS